MRRLPSCAPQRLLQLGVAVPVGGSSATPAPLLLGGAASAAATAPPNTGRPHPGVWVVTLRAA